MEEIKDYDKYPQRYYNIAGRSVINEKFDQDFDKPSYTHTAYPQQSEQTNQDFKQNVPNAYTQTTYKPPQQSEETKDHNQKIATTVPHKASPRKEPIDLGEEIYNRLKERYQMKYGTPFDAKPEPIDAPKALKSSISQSKLLESKSRINKSRVDDLIDLWRVKFKRTGHKELSTMTIKDKESTSKRLSPSKRDSLNKPGEKQNDADQKMANASRLDIEFTVNKYYTIEIEKKLKSMELNDKERKETMGQQNDQSHYFKIQNVVAQYYKCKDKSKKKDHKQIKNGNAESKKREAPKKSKQPNSRGAEIGEEIVKDDKKIENSKNEKKDEKKKEEVKAEEKMTLEKKYGIAKEKKKPPTPLQIDRILFTNLLISYYKYSKRYAANSTDLCKWYQSYSPSELTQFYSTAKISSMPTEIVSQKITDYFSNPEAQIRYERYCKIKNLTRALNESDKAISDLYSTIPNTDKLLWGFAQEGYLEYLTKITKEKINAEINNRTIKEEKERKRKERQDEILRKKVLTKPIKSHPIEELAKPMVDKYKTGKALLEWKQRYPFDNIADKLIKIEFADNRIFKYPEEYELFNEDEEKLRKMEHNKAFVKSTDPSGAANANSKMKEWVDHDKDKLVKEKQEKQKMQQIKNKVYKFVNEKVYEYLQKRDNRLNEQVGTLKCHIIESYKNLTETLPEESKIMFPFRVYGIKDPKKAPKAYPKSFKQYFVEILRSYVKINGKYKKAKQRKRKTVWLPSNSMLPNDKNNPISQSVSMSKNAKIGKHGEAGEYHEITRTKAWRRDDAIDIKKKLLMTNSDIENCQFQPHCGRYIEKSDIQRATDLYNGFGNEKFDPNREENPDNWVKALGVDFKGSHPEIFKKCKLNKATKNFNEGQLDEALKFLKEGFKLESLYRKFEQDNYEKIMKKKEQYEEMRKKLASESNGITSAEDDTIQKNMPEEDFENKKLKLIFNEAYELLRKIDKMMWQKIKEKKMPKKELFQKLNKKAKDELKEIQDSKFDQFYESWSNFVWGNTGLYKCSKHELAWNEEHVWKCNLLTTYKVTLEQWKQLYIKREEIRMSRRKVKMDKKRIGEAINIMRANTLTKKLQREKEEKAKLKSHPKEESKIISIMPVPQSQPIVTGKELHKKEEQKKEEPTKKPETVINKDPNSKLI